MLLGSDFSVLYPVIRSITHIGGTTATCAVRHDTVPYSTSTSAYFADASVTYAKFMDLAGELYI